MGQERGCFLMRCKCCGTYGCEKNGNCPCYECSYIRRIELCIECHKYEDCEFCGKSIDLHGEGDSYFHSMVDAFFCDIDCVNLHRAEIIKSIEQEKIEKNVLFSDIKYK